MVKDRSQKASRQILLVDYDPNLTLLVKDYLEFQGYKVETAENGQEALEKLEHYIPDMIVCDVMMPEMDGYAFVEKIRQDPHTSWIPLMLLSAKGQSHDRIKGLKTGADVYMIKPFEPEELVAQIESSLQQVDRFIQYRAQPSLDESERVQVPSHVVLTTTEEKVIRLVAQGMANKEIAERLSVSQRTIESHVSKMLSKTTLKNRTELARWAMQSNMK
jgi:DNA-binding NarL/FixJ family response regulator